MKSIASETEEYEGCCALLLWIIRRAAHDWVLYRGSRDIKVMAIANEAYVWLFNEGPGHPDWERRKKEGSEEYSLLAICETLGLNPNQVRARVRGMTYRDIQCVGRPPVRRKLPRNEEVDEKPVRRRKRGAYLRACLR